MIDSHSGNDRFASWNNRYAHPYFSSSFSNSLPFPFSHFQSFSFSFFFLFLFLFHTIISIIFWWKRKETISCSSNFCFLGDCRPVPAVSNSPFRRYLSNAPYPVPQFALQPESLPNSSAPQAPFEISCFSFIFSFLLHFLFKFHFVFHDLSFLIKFPF